MTSNIYIVVNEVCSGNSSLYYYWTLIYYAPSIQEKNNNSKEGSEMRGNPK
jgi:hypothetical protein